jgi:hypothetical protein
VFICIDSAVLKLLRSLLECVVTMWQHAFDSDVVLWVCIVTDCADVVHLE